MSTTQPVTLSISDLLIWTFIPNDSFGSHAKEQKMMVCLNVKVKVPPLKFSIVKMVMVSI